MKDEQAKITKHKFYFETALYERVLISDLEDDVFEGEFLGFNPVKKYGTTFTVHKSQLAYGGRRNSLGGMVGISADQGTERFWNSSLNEFCAVVLTCKQNRDQIMIFLHEDDDSVTKIGQSPSLAYIRFAAVANKYDKQLSKDDLQNYKKAVFGHAHGIGIGSFVYLRRIFENLITEAFDVYGSILAIERDAFLKLRMEEKVDALKGVLPSQLIEMKKVYGVLSRGVHELTEEECLNYFSAIRFSIELILDQKIEEKQKADKDAAVKEELRRIVQATGGKKGAN